MPKRYLSVLLVGLILAACSGAGNPAAVATESQPASTPSPTTVTTPIAPVLLKEVDLETQTGTSYSLDWSPDGQTLTAGGGVEFILISSDLEQIVATLVPSTGALIATWSADQSQFATVVGYRHTKITIWDWDPAALEIAHAHEISAAADQYGASWSPDGKLLATLANDRKSIFQIWDTGTWALLNTYELPYANPRRALNWSADSKTLYDAGELNGEVVVFGLNVEDGTVQEFSRLPTAQVYVFGVSADSEKFAVADEAGRVQIFDLASGEVLAEFQSVSQPVALAWNPVQQTLAILGYKTELQLWDIAP